ncbi:MAG: hypothetical protein D6746_01500 [Bacteroidetes bacterium]|nr:MAG: hypothetical protein D6746_01500 [Bacteroidota bacterium]
MYYMRAAKELVHHDPAHLKKAIQELAARSYAKDWGEAMPCQVREVLVGKEAEAYLNDTMMHDGDAILIDENNNVTIL